MKSKKAIVTMWIFALLPAALVLAFTPFLPERVPTHWNLDGTVTYGSVGTLWLIAALSPALAALFQFMPRIDPRKGNYEKFQDKYDTLGVLMPLILLVCLLITISESLQPGRINVGRTVGVLVGLLFVVIGNMMGKVKSSFFLGFRTPWALSDPDVWNKTQRMGGFVFFFSGLAAVVLGLFAPEKVFFWVFLLLLAGGLGATFFMSWKWYQEKG